MHGSEPEAGVGVGVLSKQGDRKIDGLSQKIADASGKTDQVTRTGKRYWPNTRTINGLKMGGLVVSKNQNKKGKQGHSSQRIMGWKKNGKSRKSRVKTESEWIWVGIFWKSGARTESEWMYLPLKAEP
jgi:hypothetical protein